MAGPAQHLVILDWDSTIFDLLGFIKALTAGAETAFEIDAKAFGGEIDRFYAHTPEGERIGYDAFAHFAAHSVDLAQPENLDRLVEATLAAHHRLTGRDDFLFPEVPEALHRLQSFPDTDVAILTVNVESAIQLKRRLTGHALDGVPVRVVQVNKGRVLASEWQHGLIYGGQAYATAVVIDDSASQIEAVPAAPGVTRLQIVRPGQKYPANATGIPTIGSLLEIPVQA